MRDPTAAARRVADDVLGPASAEVDASGVLPAGHLDALAGAGLYGVSGPEALGGAGVGRGTALRVTESLAQACLSTAFVWIQHQGVVARLTLAGAPWKPWVARLCTGEVRAGVGVGGIRPGAQPLRARQHGDRWVLDGSVPWVTGWGLVDVVHVAARDPDGGVVWLLADATESSSLVAEPLQLTAVQASRTVTLRLRGHAVPADRVTSRSTYAQWQAADVATLRGNGSLSLGLVARCAAAAAPSGGDALRRAADRVRDALDRADAAVDADALADARAAASALGWQAAGWLTVAGGGRSMLARGVADRTVREAAFLLVFASRPEIRAALQQRLA